MGKSYQQAMFEQLYQDNGNFGGGGAADFAEGDAKAQFQKSPLGIWALQNGGQKAFELAFAKQYRGGGYSAKKGPKTDADFQKFLALMPDINGEGGGGGKVSQKMHSLKAMVDQINKEKSRKSNRGTEGSTLDNLLKSYTDKLNEANEANDSRQEDILDRFSAGRDDTLEGLSTFGDSARGDIRERGDETLGNLTAQLSNRGLGNTSVPSALAQRSERDVSTQLTRLEDTLNSQKIQANQKYVSDTTGLLERRTDKAPQLAGILELAKQFGAGNAGGGFGGNLTQQYANSGGGGGGGLDLSGFSNNNSQFGPSIYNAGFFGAPGSQTGATAFKAPQNVLSGAFQPRPRPFEIEGARA